MSLIWFKLAGLPKVRDVRHFAAKSHVPHREHRTPPRSPYPTASTVPHREHSTTASTDQTATETAETAVCHRKKYCLVRGHLDPVEPVRSRYQGRYVVSAIQCGGISRYDL